MYAEDQDKANYQLLIKNLEGACLKYCSDFKIYIEYSNDMDDIEEYNPNKEHKILIEFDDMITDMVRNKKNNAIVTELFIRGRKLNISVVFITESYFVVPKKR